MDGKFVHLNWRDRFVASDLLRASYLKYEHSQNPAAKNFVAFAEEGLELGIVASDVPEVARAISSLLSCSLEDAKNDNGGHLPSGVVERVQREIISPHGVANLWGSFGHRFVLARPLAIGTSEILATVLVARRKGTVFFLTGRYNNLRHSKMEEIVDFDQASGTNPRQRWFDRFALPKPAQFKPRAYHQIANFVVAKGHRGQGLSRFFLKSIVNKYALDHIVAHNTAIEHSQYLLCGRGFWQIGDPPWLTRMERLGFYLRRGAESFFIEHDWAPLPAIFEAGTKVANQAYNQAFGMPQRYQREDLPEACEPHLDERIAEVIRIAEDPRAKLQYFQTMFDFV